MSSIKEKIKKFPTKPGVYFFLGKSGRILYIGKALSLKDRVRSYFARDLRETRNLLIEDMVQQAIDIKYEVTDSVLEALILEAALIRKHQPKYNTREKDNKSFNYVVITKEEFPRVLLVRGKELGSSPAGIASQFTAGPFPQGKLLRDALKVIRKIFPFRDRCEPLSGKPCFNHQIGLCPGVCTGEISKKEYADRVKNIKLLLSGKKKSLIKKLKKEMTDTATQHKFEEAKILRDKIFALQHIQDVSLVGREYSQNYLEVQRGREFRIESFDIAHIMGTYVVGGMIVMLGDEFQKKDYRKFKIHPHTFPRLVPTKLKQAEGEPRKGVGVKLNPGINDTAALREIVSRRLQHKEWQLPDLIVVDGGIAQKRVVESVIEFEKLSIPVIAVKKDARHKPSAILGKKEIAEKHQNNILKSNSEVHRFTTNYHKQLREKIN